MCRRVEREHADHVRRLYEERSQTPPLHRAIHVQARGAGASRTHLLRSPQRFRAPRTHLAVMRRPRIPRGARPALNDAGTVTRRGVKDIIHCHRVCRDGRLQRRVLPMREATDERPALFCRHRVLECCAQTHQVQRHGLAVAPIRVRRVLRRVRIDERLGDLRIPCGVTRIVPLEHRPVPRPASRCGIHVCVNRSLRGRYPGPATKACDVRHPRTVTPGQRRTDHVCGCGPTSVVPVCKLVFSRTWRSASPTPVAQVVSRSSRDDGATCAPRSEGYGRRWSVSPSCSWRPCLDRGIADEA